MTEKKLTGIDGLDAYLRGKIRKHILTPPSRTFVQFSGEGPVFFRVGGKVPPGLVPVSEADSRLSESAADYRSGLRTTIRGLWLGVLDYYEAYDNLDSVIRKGMTSAWAEGAATCGIAPDEMSPEERLELQQAIIDALGYVDGLLTFVMAHSKAEGGKLGVVGKTGGVMSRVDLWVNRYEEIRQKAMTIACADMKTRWTLGVSEHCDSCVKLAGKIKRNSYWQKVGILPRVPGADYLDCRGYACQCTLVPTDEPLSKGPLPRLP